MLRILLLSFLSVSILAGSTAQAVDLGIVGKTYPIRERDAIAEMKERAKTIDWSKALRGTDREKSLREYRPGDLVALPRALKDDVRTVSLDYTLQFDVTDNKGNVIYPKGFTFNPLDYMNYSRTIVVLNGVDKDQIAWFKSSIYRRDAAVKLLITDGSYYDLSKDLGLPVYYASSKIAGRFQLKAVPSIVTQKGNYLEVKEVAIPKSK